MGRLEVIVGPMYSGKSEELIRRLRRNQLAGKVVQAYKPFIDNRYDLGSIQSHSQASFKAHPLTTDEYDSDYINGLSGLTNVVGIDEIQFFNEKIIRAILRFVQDDNMTFVVSGLDMNYRQEPFGIVPHLMAIADRVDKLTAVCHTCGEEAMFTQRLINGEPASFEGPEIQIGGFESYEARCRNCFRKG